MPERLECWNCPALSFSCLCPGFRQLLDLASSGRKSDDLICDRCPVPGLNKEMCAFGCNVFSPFRDGFRQVYNLASYKEMGT